MAWLILIVENGFGGSYANDAWCLTAGIETNHWLVDISMTSVSNMINHGKFAGEMTAITVFEAVFQKSSNNMLFFCELLPGGEYQPWLSMIDHSEPLWGMTS